MSSKSTPKDRKRKIRFVGGPRDGDEIEWTQPCAPRDRMDYHNINKAHIYKRVARYSYNTQVIYFYTHTRSIKTEGQNHERYYR
jgi:hypothetical protein